jgi:hypothetical protein
MLKAAGHNFTSIELSAANCAS